MESVFARDLPSALESASIGALLGDRTPAVFLDYDGVLTPIVPRPEDARMSENMRATLRALAERCPVCIVTGRDRDVVQQLMGVDDLTVASSHGFEIWQPGRGELTVDGLDDYSNLVAETTETLRRRTAGLEGVQLEPKRASVAVHYRRAAPDARDRVSAIVRDLVDDPSGRLAVVPGKMVYELKPAVDWDKGRAVLHLLDVLGLDRPDTVPLYLGDDITDEDAFHALRDRGVGILVYDADDPDTVGRTTEARYTLASVDDVERFLTGLARPGS
ncbi:trehalose-phosphatase [Rhodococcus yananensis]|uniref:trehalose-phosphatase n=1 Tax=Rhodococcus yananensis TaxID=2879464 RepID=UPI003EB78014